MKKVCAWCGRELELGGGKIDGKVSHGICLACALGLKKEAKGGGLGGVTREEKDLLLNFERGEALK